MRHFKGHCPAQLIFAISRLNIFSHRCEVNELSIALFPLFSGLCCKRLAKAWKFHYCIARLLHFAEFAISAPFAVSLLYIPCIDVRSIDLFRIVFSCWPLSTTDCYHMDCRQEKVLMLTVYFSASFSWQIFKLGKPSRLRWQRNHSLFSR